MPENTKLAAETVDEFLVAMGIGRTLFYSEVKKGRIRIVKLGRRTLVPRSERERLLSGSTMNEAA
ncbi:DNA-binding protein [Lichenibacterium dinghuense]|uniref:DNA-binding protein n=1 Tax=Lichenibacterium dinghuense TaxID=2895977 RepID=UPI001F2A1999|nr:DNA-binding protein [Lichenibacterium sp. 6Y81]